MTDKDITVQDAAITLLLDEAALWRASVNASVTLGRPIDPQAVFEFLDELAGEVSDQCPQGEDDAVPQECEPEPDTLTVDWDQIPEGFNWVARDQDGAVWVYADKPHALGSLWAFSGRKLRLADSVNCPDAVTRPGSEPWKEAIVQRPEPEPDTLWVDWDVLDPDFICVTRDKVGLICAHRSHPSWGACSWVTPADLYIDLQGLLHPRAYRPGSEPWKEAITYRPGYGPEDE